MGHATMQGHADGAEEGLFSKEQGLSMHIVGNFYPPHPDYVQKSMMKGFKKYWNRKIGLKELQEACHLRDLDGLYRYFESFLNEEDRE